VTIRLTQRQRVLQALQRVGARGLTQVDFLMPSVIDGGAPITRVGARIEELRAAGHQITSTGRRDRCAVYVLHIDGPAHTPIPEPDPPAEPPLFGDGPRNAIFDDVDDAA
jgi:hypothetical protein